MMTFPSAVPTAQEALEGLEAMERHGELRSMKPASEQSESVQS